MQKDCRGTAVKNFINIFLSDFCFTFHHNIVTLNGNNLTGIFVNEILVPTLQYTGCKFAAYGFLHILLVHLHLLGKTEYLKNILVGLVADGTQQCCHRQFLLTVDVGVHHIVDVCCKLYPRALERNYTRTVERSTVGMNTLTEEHTRRTVQL